MAGVQRTRLPAPESRPYLAFGAALGIDMLLLLFLLVPPFGFLVVLTIGPYVGGRIGGRYAARREAAYAGAVAAAMMATVLAVIIIYAMNLFPGGRFDILEPIGFTLLVVGYLVAILFGALGGRHGSASRKKAARSG